MRIFNTHAHKICIDCKFDIVNNKNVFENRIMKFLQNMLN